ncbi:MAG: TIM barrel protein [Candidatus Pacearchaeota archaeon]
MTQGNYSIKDLYAGGTSSFSPNYGETFTGQHVPAGKLGVSQNPGTANQLAELDKSLKQGTKTAEVQALDPSLFEAIPKHQFEDIRRTAKLAGAKATMHAPVQEMDPAGVSGREQRWSELNRKQIEKQLKDVADKAHLMDQDGNMPITIHNSNVPGNVWEKDPETGEKRISSMTMIDKGTGAIQKLEEEEKYEDAIQAAEAELHGEKSRIGEKRTWTPQEKIDNQNRTYWQDQIDQTFFNKERVDELIKGNEPKIQKALEMMQEYGVENKKDQDKFLQDYPELKEPLRKFEAAQSYLQDINKKVSNLIDEGFKFSANEKQKEKFKELNEEYKERIKESRSITERTEEIQKLMEEMKRREYVPKKYENLQEFQKKKAKETFANVAMHAYDNYGDKAPVVSIENMFPGQFGFAKGEEMNELIQESRSDFINRAQKPKSQGGLGLSKSQAEEKANKLIGMTFDVGHLNLQKKYGFSDKDLQKEFSEMAKNGTLKHVHLTDNFGHHDSHLGPGMGNVPFKKYYEEMKKQGYDPNQIDQIVEAAALPNNFGTMMYPASVEGMGSPIYGNNEQPYWNQAPGLQQGYSPGYGEFLPQGHFSQWGAGFSQLPSELGGSMGGSGGSRVSGNPME